MNKIWTESFNIHTYEVDALGRMSLPVLGSLLQEAASRHAVQLGWGYDALISQNCIWVLTALKIQMDRDPHWEDQIIIKTWPSGKNRFFYFRDFKIENQEGKFLGSATTNWIIINTATRKPVRLEIAEPFDYTEMDSLFEAQPKKWPVREEYPLIETIHVRFDDLDINNHVNNIRYFDWILRSVPSDFRKAHRLKTFEIHFLAEGVEEDKIDVFLHQDGQTLQHLLKRQSDGKSLTQALSQWEKP